MLLLYGLKCLFNLFTLPILKGQSFAAIYFNFLYEANMCPYSTPVMYIAYMLTSYGKLKLKITTNFVVKLCPYKNKTT